MAEKRTTKPNGLQSKERGDGGDDGRDIGGASVNVMTRLFWVAHPGTAQTHRPPPLPSASLTAARLAAVCLIKARKSRPDVCGWGTNVTACQAAALEECPPDEFDKGGWKEVAVLNQTQIKICSLDEATKLLSLSFSF